jgi:cell division protein FtsL
MAFENLLFVFVILFGILLINLSNKSYLLKKEIKQLNKQLSEDLTDYEKLVLAIKLMSEVNRNKLNVDKLDMWIEWMEMKIKTLKEDI